MMPSLADTLAMVGDSERAPHLYYLIAWLWSRPFGVGEVGLRSLSALLGTATIPFAYLAARSLVSRHAGLITAWLVAVSPFLVFYSQEARTYAFLTFLGTIALWFFARALREQATRNLAGWAIFSSLALASHYFAAFPFVAEAAILLWKSRDRLRVVLFMAVPLIAGAALFPLALDQGEMHDSVGSALPGYRDLATVIVQFVAGERLGVRGIYSLIPVAGALLCAGSAAVLVAGVRRRATGAVASGLIGGAALAGPLLLAVAGGDEVAGAGIFSAKNAIGAVVPLTILIAFGIVLLPRPQLRIMTTVIFCSAMACIAIAANVVTGLQRPDWRAAAELADRPTRQALVVGAGGDDPMLYYLRARRARRMPPEGARVAVVTHISTGPRLTPIRPFRSFSHNRSRHLEGFTITNFRTVSPLAVSPKQLTRRTDEAVLLLAKP